MKFILLFLFTSFSFLSANEQDDSFLKSTVALTGNVFNEVTKQGETCVLKAMDLEGNRAGVARSNASQNGAYFIPGLTPGKSYNITVKKKGFMKEIHKITVPKTNRYIELSQDFLVKPLENGIKIPLAVPPFELNKSKLRFGSELFLENMKNALNTNKKVKIKIQCFPDSDDNLKTNAKLTSERASTLKAFFTKNGIDASRIEVASSKKTDPDNPPPTKRQAKGKRYIGSSYFVITSF